MYCNEVLLLFSITPSHSDAFIKPWKELKISIKAGVSVCVCVCLAIASIPEQPFPLPHHCGIFDLASTPSTALVGWMIQNFLAQTTAPTAVWCYTIMLRDHNLQQFIIWATPATLEMLPFPQLRGSIKGCSWTDVNARAHLLLS